MRLTVASAVMAELGRFDLDFGIGIAAGKNAIFIIEKAAVPNEQIAALVSDSGTVAVANACAGKFDSIDGDIIALDEPDSFFICGFVVGDDPNRAIDSPKDQIALGPHGDVANVVARIDQHFTPIRCDGGSFSARRNCAPWTDAYDLISPCVVLGA
jgi:hypothetical protein